MIYLDTSFLTPYYVQEPTTSQVKQIIMAASPGTFCISYWVVTEFASALARKERMQLLDQNALNALMAALLKDVAEALQVITPVQEDFNVATDLLLLPKTGLRAGDALHLSIASRRNLDIYSLDKGLIDAALILGISVSDKGVINL
jgi:uncharacterized protein